MATFTSHRLPIGGSRGLELKPSVAGRGGLRPPARQSRVTRVSAAVELLQTANSVSSSLLDGVNAVAQGAPGPLQAVISTLGGDLASVVSLNPTLVAIPRLGVRLLSLPSQHVATIAETLTTSLHDDPLLNCPSLPFSPPSDASQAIWYFCFSSPSPLVNIIDFYVTGPLVLALSNNFEGKTFTLRDR